MCKSCVRYKRLEDLPLELIGQAIARAPVDECMRHYQAVHKVSKRKPKR